MIVVPFDHTFTQSQNFNCYRKLILPVCNYYKELGELEPRILSYGDFLESSEVKADKLIAAVDNETAKRYRITILSSSTPKRRFLKQIRLSYTLADGKAAVYTVILGRF